MANLNGVRALDEIAIDVGGCGEDGRVLDEARRRIQMSNSPAEVNSIVLSFRDQVSDDIFNVLIQCGLERRKEIAKSRSI